MQPVARYTLFACLFMASVCHAQTAVENFARQLGECNRQHAVNLAQDRTATPREVAQAVLYICSKQFDRVVVAATARIPSDVPRSIARQSVIKELRRHVTDTLVTQIILIRATRH